MFLSIRRSAVIAGLAAVAVLAPAAPALAFAPLEIDGISFSGQAGDAMPSPTLTITGSGFARQPTGTDNNVTSCGPYTANGEDYGYSLYFQDANNFTAGRSNRNGGACIGIIVVSWSSNRVVLRFGNAYGSFAHWYLTNGDGYAISIKQHIFGGTVAGLT